MIHLRTLPVKRAPGFRNIFAFYCTIWCIIHRCVLATIISPTGAKMAAVARPGLLYGVHYIILQYRYRTETENRYRHLTKSVVSNWKYYQWFELT